MAAAIGIDLGSNKAVMGVVKRKGIEVVLNEGSNRSTPVVIAYQDQERIIGDAVKTQMKRNFKNSIQFPTRFLGLNATCVDQIAHEMKFVTHNVVTLPNNKIAFEVTQAGVTHTFTVEQTIAFYLKKLMEFYVKDEVLTKDIVVTVPSYASNTERQALVDACDIAGLNCLRVINESTAIAYNYGFFRKGDLEKENERIVCFVDMGHSKTTVTIAGFKQQESRIIVHMSDRNLGGRDLDYQIMQKLGEEFFQKHGEDPRTNPRCVLRLFEGVEKARKLLSGDTECSINVDYLINEEDLNRKLSREEFEQLIDPQVRQLATLLKSTLEASKLSPDEIHFVELVGDATRTPIVQAIIKQIFEKQELQRTLNSLDCIARGASLNSAMMTPNFSVQAFTMHDYNNLPVTINYQFTDPVTGEAKEPKMYQNFFALGQKFPLVQALKFDNKEGQMTLSISYDESAALMTGLPQTIAQYDIGKGKKSHAEVPGSFTKLAIRVKNNINQIPELERVEMTEHWTEEEKIPIKTGGGKPAAAPKEEKKADGAPAAEDKKEEAPVPEEQKYELKTRKKERTTDVLFKTVSHAIPPEMKTQYKNLENQLMVEDRKILDLKEAKYMLESFTYEIKNGVDQYGNFEHYVDPVMKPTLLENLAATEAWIYAEGENAPLSEQLGRLEALQSIGNPIKSRYRFREELPDYVKIYQKSEGQTLVRMNETTHLTEAQRQTIEDKCALMQQFYMELQQEIETRPKYEDPSISLKQLEIKQTLFEAEVKSILDTPPPAPKKEEEKKETEPAAEGEGQPAADAEMANEEPPALDEEPKTE